MGNCACALPAQSEYFIMEGKFRRSMYLQLDVSGEYWIALYPKPKRTCFVKVYVERYGDVITRVLDVVYLLNDGPVSEDTHWMIPKEGSYIESA